MPAEPPRPPPLQPPPGAAAPRKPAPKPAPADGGSEMLPPPPNDFSPRAPLASGHSAVPAGGPDAAAAAAAAACVGSVCGGMQRVARAWQQSLATQAHVSLTVLADCVCLLVLLAAPAGAWNRPDNVWLLVPRPAPPPRPPPPPLARGVSRARARRSSWPSSY